MFFCKDGIIFLGKIYFSFVSVLCLEIEYVMFEDRVNFLE